MSLQFEVSHVTAVDAKKERLTDKRSDLHQCADFQISAEFNAQLMEMRKSKDFNNCLGFVCAQFK